MIKRIMTLLLLVLLTGCGSAEPTPASQATTASGSAASPTVAGTVDPTAPAPTATLAASAAPTQTPAPTATLAKPTPAPTNSPAPPPTAKPKPTSASPTTAARPTAAPTEAPTGSPGATPYVLATLTTTGGIMGLDQKFVVWSDGKLELSERRQGSKEGRAALDKIDRLSATLNSPEFQALKEHYGQNKCCDFFSYLITTDAQSVAFMDGDEWPEPLRDAFEQLQALQALLN